MSRNDPFRKKEPKGGDPIIQASTGINTKQLGDGLTAIAVGIVIGEVVLTIATLGLYQIFKHSDLK